MKKQFLNIVGAIAIGSFLLVSCSEATKADAVDAIEAEHSHDHAAAYQCPMDCEEGKTYNEPGKCPICEMDIVELEHQH